MPSLTKRHFATAALVAATCLALALANPLVSFADELPLPQEPFAVNAEAPEAAQSLETPAEDTPTETEEASEQGIPVEDAALLDEADDESPAVEVEPDEPEALKPGWNKADDGTWRYGKADGSPQTGWIKVKGIWYWLDPAEDGLMATGLRTVNGKDYHFKASGAMSIGWAKEGSTWYYATSSGALKTGWIKLKDVWYWLEPANGGAMATGLFEAKGEWFTAADSGAVRIDKWSLVGDTWYRVDGRGETMTGWFTSGSKKYWLAPEKHGAMATGFFEVEGARYFAESSGSVLTSQWIESEGKLLLAGTDGTLVAEGSRTYDGKIRLKPAQGISSSGWQTIGGCKMFADPATGGTLACGWLKDADRIYWANDQGIIQTGWEDIEGSRYYFDEEGALVTGWVKIADTWFYLAEDGKMLTGWLELGEDKYYLREDGSMVTGTCLIGDKAYRFAGNGKFVSVEKQITAKAQTFSSSTPWLILVDTKENKVGVFNGKKGNWNIVKYWDCTTGAPVSPTVKGSFTVGNRGMHFGEEKGYTCWYWTQFYGDYLFHSILYNPYSKTSIQDGRLGQNLSHGCVRLEIDNAKWIYDNIPRGTKVYVY